MKKLLTTLLFIFSTVIILFSQNIESVEINVNNLLVDGTYVPSGITINGCECYENSVTGLNFYFREGRWGLTFGTCSTNINFIQTLSAFNSGVDICDLSQLIPVVGGQGHSVTINFLPLVPLVPTLSQWGIIILAILLLAIGIVYARQSQVATKSGNFSLSLQQLPFELSTYRNIWLMVACIIVAVFTVLIQFFGYEMTQADPIGATLSSFLLAYLLFLLKK